jgi:hypothetical protein
MKTTTKTDTTFERYSTETKDRQIITVLSVSVRGVVCAVESIPLDGRDVSDYVTTIQTAGVPRSILNRFGG